jgi:hypothetical protein
MGSVHLNQPPLCPLLFKEGIKGCSQRMKRIKRMGNEFIRYIRLDGRPQTEAQMGDVRSSGRSIR